MDNKSIFTITGPSGVGKTKVYKGIISREDLGLKKLITCTTRERREDEIDGIDYHFLSKRDFRNMLSRDKFLEHARVYGNYYGCRKEDVETAIKSGGNTLLVLDVKGALTMQSYFRTKNISIFLLPDNMGELLIRLNGRGTDAEKDIEKRIARAEKEISKAYDFDYRVINKQGELPNTIERVLNILRYNLQ